MKPFLLALSAPWTETLNDSGSRQSVKVLIPMGSNGRRFVRLEIHSFY